MTHSAVRTDEVQCEPLGADEDDRVLATVLFTDIVGSTKRASELGDRQWRTIGPEGNREHRA